METTKKTFIIDMDGGKSEHYKGLNLIRTKKTEAKLPKSNSEYKEYYYDI